MGFQALWSLVQEECRRLHRPNEPISGKHLAGVIAYLSISVI